MHRRFTFPLSISLRGQVYPLINWSEGGVLIAVAPSALEKDILQHAEVLISCSDGMYSLPVQISPIRLTSEGWACKFVDLPAREQAILRFFADIVLRGDGVLMAELDAAGKLAHNVIATPPPKEEPPVLASGPFAFLQVPWRYVGLIMGLIVTVGLLAFVVVPYIGANVIKKFTKGEHLEVVARARVQAAQLSIADLEQKIRLVQSFLSEAQPGGTIPLRPEQIRALQVGLEQLETEREMALVHLGVMEKNLALIKKGDFLIEEAVFSGYNTDARLTQMPFLDTILNDLAVSGRSAPTSPESLAGFQKVAGVRLSQARFALETVEVKRDTLEKIVARAEAAGAASAFPQNTLDLMRRDLELLRIEEQRLADTIGLLEDNVRAVQEGNFTYETQLLQRFDPRILPSTGAQSPPSTE
jgi:hypothetical protein